ncbi:Zn2/Cys6 DNA-binding protein [Ilyonectria robusta]
MNRRSGFGICRNRTTTSEHGFGICSWRQSLSPPAANGKGMIGANGRTANGRTSKTRKPHPIPRVKCDGVEPTCSNCRKREDSCSYPQGRKRAHSSRVSYRDMSHRLDEIQRKLSLHQAKRAVVDQPCQQTMTNQTVLDEGPILQSIAEVTTPNPPILERDGGGEGENDAVTHPVSPLPPLSTQHSFPLEGSCSILSQQSALWVDTIVGDNSFSQVLQHVEGSQNFPTLHFDASHMDPLPPQNVINDCLADFLHPLNQNICLFPEEHLIALAQNGPIATACPVASRYAALSIVCAVSLRAMSGMRNEQSEKLLQNTLKTLPYIITDTPDIIAIGICLSTTFYLMLTSRNNHAATILGAAAQMIIIAGYSKPASSKINQKSDTLHKQRLFWQAYIVDRDLSMRLGKPPCISDDLRPPLPEEQPDDGYSSHTLANGSTMNFLREQVLLAEIQDKCYRVLRSGFTSSHSKELLYAGVNKLDEELQGWRNRIPEIINPHKPLPNVEYGLLMALTTLHCTYFQLMIAVHSVTFDHPLSNNNPSCGASTSQAKCINAARASLSLLGYHDVRHPFTIYLLDHLAWSVDIIFLNILQNKESPGVLRDLHMLKRILTLFEKYDSDRDKARGYLIVRALHGVASRAIHRAILAGRFQGEWMNLGTTQSTVLNDSAPILSNDSSEAREIQTEFKRIQLLSESK